MKPRRILTFIGLAAAAWLINRILNRAVDGMGDRDRAIENELSPFGLN